MANQDLFFNILARDRGAAKTLNNVADAADHTSKRLSSLSMAMAAIGSAPGLGGFGAGALMGLPALAGAGTAALGALAVAVNGVGAAFSAADDPEQFAEAMDKLAPSAKNFVREGIQVNEMLVDFRRNVQGEFFKPLEGSFSRLSDTYLPTLVRQLPVLSEELGKAGRSWTSTVTSTSSAAAIGQVLESSHVVVRNFSSTVNSLTSAFLKAAGAGGQFGQRVTRDIASAAAAFDRFVSRAQGDGSLARLFDTAADSAHSLGQALGPLAKSLYTLFSSEGAAASAQAFFTALGLGAQVVTTLVNAFAALPPGMQSTIVVLGVAGLLAGKTFEALRALSSGLAVTAIAMQNLGGASVTAARGVTIASTAISRAAGPIGIAIGIVAALSVAMSSSGSAANAVEVDVTRLADAFKVFTATGKITGELAKQTGGSFEALAAKIVIADRAVAKAKAMADDTPFDMAFARKAREAAAKDLGAVETSIKAVTTQIAEMARSGDVRGAAMGAEQFRTAMLGSGKSVEWVNAQLEEYTNVTGGATVAMLNAQAASKTFQTQQEILNGTWEESINRLGSLSAAFDLLNGKFLTSREAEIAAETAAAAFAVAIKASNGSLDERTDKGRAAESALIGLARATDTAVQKAYDQALVTGTQSEALVIANKLLLEHKQQLIDAAIAAGIDEVAAKKLADQYIKMPKDVTTNVSAPGATKSTSEIQALRDKIAVLEGKQVKITDDTPEARRRLAEYQREIDALRGKTIYLTTVEQRISRQTSGDQQVNGRRLGSIDYAMAAGGAIASHFVHSPTVLYGEGRGSEAYISESAPVGRSREIARKTVDAWLGGPGKIWPELAGGDGTAAALDRLTMAVMTSSSRQGRAVIGFADDAVGELIVRLLRPVIKSQGGDVQFVLGP